MTALKSANTFWANGIADYVLTGGVTGQLFLAAKGVDFGKGNMGYLAKKELTGLIPGIKTLMDQFGEKVVVPIDFAVDVKRQTQRNPSKQTPNRKQYHGHRRKNCREIQQNHLNRQIHRCKRTNGSLRKQRIQLWHKGVFEAIANSKAFSLAGGGNTIAAIQEYGLTKKIGYISTAGGALIEFLMGKKLPGVIALENAVIEKKI